MTLVTQNAMSGLKIFITLIGMNKNSFSLIVALAKTSVYR